KRANDICLNNFERLCFDTNRLRSSLHERTFGATATKISRGRVLFFSPPPTLIQRRRRDLKEGSVKQTSREGSWISNRFWNKQDAAYTRRQYFRGDVLPKVCPVGGNVRPRA